MSHIKYVFLVFVLIPIVVSANQTERTDVVLKQSSQEMAQLNGLTVKEWERYQYLMKGPYGKWYKDLIPQYVLALDAEPGSIERRSYMERIVEIEYKRVENELSMQREYNQVSNELFADVLPLDEAKFMGTENIIFTNDRFVVLVNSECSGCEKEIKQKLSKISMFPKHGKDFYFIGAKTQEDIKSFAGKIGIEAKEVYNGRYTLNFSGGLEDHLSNKQNIKIYIRRGDDLYPTSFIGL